MQDPDSPNAVLTNATLLIKIEVAYALPGRQYLLSISLPAGSSIEQAIHQSGILERCPEIDLGANKVGIYSRPAKLSDLVQDADRVEIYRPLLIDPKEWRRKRAEQMKK